MIGRESGDIWAVFGGLLVFGVLYNALYAWLERHGYDVPRMDVDAAGRCPCGAAIPGVFL